MVLRHITIACFALAAEAYVQRLSEQQHPQIYQLNVVIVDGFQSMVTAAVRKLSPQIESTAGKLCHIVKGIFGELGQVVRPALRRWEREVNPLRMVYVARCTA